LPEPARISRAKLQAIRLADGDAPSEVVDEDKTVEVQFNPESLKVTYSNTVSNDDQAGGSAIQHVTKSSTTLTVDLWFDATRLTGVQDVREKTNQVKDFFTPVEQDGGLAPPAVRFLWGSFLFEGVMSSLDETLEFFSAAGNPLRAQLSLSIVSQDLQSHIFTGDDDGAPGTRPQRPAAEGEGLQQLLGRDGDPSGWQDVAAANGIENPRFLQPGSFVDPAAGRR
jgi:hypothetical protein